MTDFQIIDLVVGTGKAAERGSLITAHYTGTLTDGAEFDSSHRRGQVFECVIGTGRVIKGWDLGVLGSETGVKLLDKWGIELDLPNFPPMQVGGKRRLYVPAFLAYGERAVGKILPNSDLIFEIELIDVKTRDE
ncbi:FKBP-type peptidyl-prolyl cis-trans isomerase [Moraxella sp. VT-16-12]|uniref:FKBP-type peptidyl-prolyl cis-trans isomerase n=1 Tax=Moraxella sp. VT-16-12 TaxID=2014877 RepID=UPI000B7FB7A8|nr:FKBP-type peptidyl-prolyl cis-trans isomerase [Moraxella sp. VT-16-12]TWV80935.1 FKBP-type peptidyl-prolyl cis-trans isomerase [Moraxella sp. VT-16-12]